MLSQKREFQSFDTSDSIMPVELDLPEAEEVEVSNSAKPTRFHGKYADCMEMSATAQIVAEYLNAHQHWFVECAHPMKVEPLGENGYALTIGRFGSFGYEVEPKIGLELLPPEAGIYHIRTIEIPGYHPLGYDVDYKAALQLVERQVDGAECQETVTMVEWELDLTVDVQFPKFIHKLPKSLVESTGDKLLNQIVRQVSRRLTRKVQEHFYDFVGIPFPAKGKKR